MEEVSWAQGGLRDETWTGDLGLKGHSHTIVQDE